MEYIIPSEAIAICWEAAKLPIILVRLEEVLEHHLVTPCPCLPLTDPSTSGHASGHAVISPFLCGNAKRSDNHALITRLCASVNIMSR